MLTCPSFDSPDAKAIQPFSIAKSSDHKFLSQRLFDKIAQSRDKFEAAGIVIAFPQRDVHLDATAPIPVRVLGDGE